MNPIAWLKTNAELAGALAATLFFMFASGALGYNLIKAHGEIKAGIRSLALVTWERDTAHRDLGTCHDSLKTVSASLDTQNAAVGALKAEGDRRSAEAAKAVLAAQKQADGFHVQALNLANAKPVGDRCVAAADLLRGELGR